MGHADCGSKSSPLGVWGLKQLVTEKLIFHIFEVPYKSMFRFLAAAGYERENTPEARSHAGQERIVQVIHIRAKDFPHSTNPANFL
jgi:hypothetical protein